MSVYGWLEMLQIWWERRVGLRSTAAWNAGWQLTEYENLDYGEQVMEIVNLSS